MYNIKQITDQTQPKTEIYKDVIIAGDPSTKKVQYYIYDLIGEAVKIGYCCEPKYIGYPIFLVFKEGEEETNPISFEVGKTGMFEFQPETYYNINDFTEEYTAIVHCTKVSVPAGCKFVFDYWTSIN